MARAIGRGGEGCGGSEFFFQRLAHKLVFGTKDVHLSLAEDHKRPRCGTHRRGYENQRPQQNPLLAAAAAVWNSMVDQSIGCPVIGSARWCCVILHAFSGSVVRACRSEAAVCRRPRFRRAPCVRLRVPRYTFLSGLPLGGLWRVCRGMQVLRCSSLSCDIKLGGIAAFAKVSAIWSTHRTVSRQPTPFAARPLSHWMTCVCCC